VRAFVARRGKKKHDVPDNSEDQILRRDVRKIHVR
jgi:hypothetical protein